MLEMLKERKAALEARGKKGFTLMEMLIVIAIIAVLVAIAIPVLRAQLDKANAATDEANIRDGYAAAQVMYLDGKITASTSYYLQKDGTIAATGSGDYQCKGNSSALGLTGDPEVGGVTITGGWTKDAKITYTFDASGKLTIATA